MSNNYEETEKEVDEFLDISAYVFDKKESFWTLQKAERVLFDKVIPVYESIDNDDFIKCIVLPDEALFKDDNNVYAKQEYITKDVSAYCLYRRQVKV